MRPVPRACPSPPPPGPRPGRFPGILLPLAACLALLQVRAQLPLPRLLWIHPPGAQAGSPVEVQVGGLDLDEPVSLEFSHPDLHAIPGPGGPDRFQLTLPADLPPGVVDVRFRGRFGLSNPRAFAIGADPEWLLNPTNTAPGSALDLPRRLTVNGRSLPQAHLWFRFDTQPGERFQIGVDTRRIDSQLVPDLAVFTPDLHELAIARGRSRLDFTAPGPGPFLLRLNDSLFQGGDRHAFRLRLDPGPHVEFVLPDVVQPGVSRQVTVFGRNLPGGTPSPYRGPGGTLLEQCTVEITAPRPTGLMAPAEAFPWRAAAVGLDHPALDWPWQPAPGIRVPLRLFLSTHPVVTVPEPGLVPVTPPCEVAGVFAPGAQPNGVTFTAAQGEVLWVELISERLGHPTDPHAVIQRERSTRGPSGEVLHADVAELSDADANPGDRELPVSSRDAAVRFEAPQAGTYRILVRDLFNPGPHQPRWPWRLSLRRETPDFQLVALPMPPERAGDNRSIPVLPAVVRRDQTVPLKVIALRRDGFNGPIRLSAAGLPPGVTAADGIIPAGTSTGMLLFTAAADATGFSRFSLTGEALVSGQVLVRTARTASVSWPVADFNNEAVRSRPDQWPALAVVDTESAPVRIDVGDGSPIGVGPDGRLTLPVRIRRQPGFTAAFSVRPAGHEALTKAAETSIPENATGATVELVLKEPPLPPGRHTLWLQGAVAGKYRNNPEALAAAEEALRAADTALASASPDRKPMAEERRQVAEATRAAAEKRAQPVDITVPVWSHPFVVDVHPAPPPEVAP